MTPELANPTERLGDTSSPETSEFCIIGIGASAGGLDPIQRFFDRTPPDSGAAYVVIQHLSPDFKSLMPDLLRRHTSMPVVRVTEQTLIEPDHVYLISVGHDLVIEDGFLQVVPQVRDGRLNLPIDKFYESLASWARQLGIGVVLSGTGSDGSRGVRAIKEAGGIVLVQDPNDAEFDGMPRSATATGCIDLVLKSDDIPDRVQTFLRYWQRNGALLSCDEGLTDGSLGVEDDLVEPVLTWLWQNAQVDFRGYKRSTMLRRIQRRAMLLQLSSNHDYLQHLNEHPAEANALLQELLISVTSLFRDPAAFKVIEEQVAPALLRHADGPIRIWVPACATGEEAYSLAILFDEAIRQSGRHPNFKVFATDIDERALARASEGRFHRSIEDQLNGHRLTTYFDRKHSGEYQIRRIIRDRVVFARHDIISDPPFTKINLVSCRNLLIYLNAQLQDQVLQMLHFALVKNGAMFLGPSETLGSNGDAFDTIDARWRIFRKLQTGRLPLHLRSRMSAPSHRATHLRDRGQGPRSQTAESMTFRLAWSSLCQDLQLVTLMTDADWNLTFSVGDARRYTCVSDGTPSLGIKDLLSGELRVALCMAQRKLADGSESMRVSRVRHEGALVDLMVRALTEDGGPPTGYVVSIRECEVGGRNQSAPFDVDSVTKDHIRHLETELEITRENLQASLEQVETSNEELQSANEELMAANEELQSTNEELQSVNEELYTVNAEHQDKISELSNLSAEMEALLRSIDVGTVFLDEDLCICEFTPAVAEIVAILPSDVGRPFHDLSHRLTGVDMKEIVARVVEKKETQEFTTRHEDGRSYLLRALPYERQSVKRVGVVVTFTDVSEIEKAKFDLAEREQLFRELIHATDCVYWMATAENSRILYCSPAFETIWGTPVSLLYENPRAWIAPVHAEDRPAVRAAIRDLTAANVEFRIETVAGERWIKLRGHPVVDEDGRVVRAAGTAVDITAEKAQDREMEVLVRRLEEQANNDPLTGLLNRRGLEKNLAMELERCRRSGSRIVATLVDLDDFKGINDRLGHSIGDVVLQQVSRRATASLRPTDLVARIGGDEFLALLPETRIAEGMRIAERLRLAISDSPLVVSGEPIKVTASLGVALVPADAASVEEIVARVQRTLSLSKGNGKNRVASETHTIPVRHDEDGVGDLLDRLAREDCIRAVAQQIRGLKDEAVVGFELLSRGPTGPFENPYDLFRVCMDNNLLTMMDLKCLRTCVQWSRDAGATGKLHVNLFPSTLLDTPPERLAKLLDEDGRLDRYCIEISEQQFIGDPNYLREPIRLLREFGATIAIDDVGFGRSCLESLIILEPNVIKVDRSFVHEVDLRADKQRQLCRLINAAEGLGAEIVAEGVETAAEARFIRESGIRYAQGFLWGKPVPSFETN